MWSESRMFNMTLKVELLLSYYSCKDFYFLFFLHFIVKLGHLPICSRSSSSHDSLWSASVWLTNHSLNWVSVIWFYFSSQAEKTHEDTAQQAAGNLIGGQNEQGSSSSL